MINGTEFINDPIGTAFKPFTDIFQHLVGNGNVFYLVPLIALTLGIWYKTDEPVMASMFMLGSGAILGAGTMTAGMESMSIVFTIFAAIGFTILIVSLILERRA
jgi:hypothetical protein